MKNNSSLFRSIEELHNKASDTNFVWFPFTFLRPSPEEKIGHTRRTLMALFFGFYYGVVYCLKRFVFQETLSLEAFLKNTLVATISFFIWFNLVTAPLWNRRANKILGTTTQ